MKESIVEITNEQLRVQQTEKVVVFLDKIGAYEYVQRLLSDHETRKAISFEEFRDFIVRLNGIVRDIPIDERGPDGHNVYLSGFDSALVPNHKDKEDILRDAYNALDKIASGDEAFLIPAVINATHLFMDGNGRTSRILHTLLTKFNSIEDFTEKLRVAVGEHGRYKTEDINPAIITADIDKIILVRHGISFKNNEGWSPVCPEGFYQLFFVTEKVNSKSAKEFMELRKIDQPLCFVSAYEFLTERETLLKNVSEIGDGIALSPFKMDQNLTATDWDEIMKRYYALKKECVQILIDAFIKPEDYKNLDGSMNLRDYFLKEIQVRLNENKSE